jgi:membrane protease YdiL (CAAX protease family)
VVIESWNNLQKILTDLRFEAEAIAVLAAVAGIIVYLLWRPGGIPRHLVGHQRWPEIPWQLVDVMLAFFLYITLESLWASTPWSKPQLEPKSYAGFEPSAAASAALAAYDQGISGGFLAWVGAVAVYPEELARQVREVRIGLINSIILFPALVSLLVITMVRMSGARLYQLGAHLAHWRENVTLGYLTWIIAAPVVILISAVVQLDFWNTLWGRPTPHPIAVALNMDNSFTTYFLALVVTCLVAPVKEELLTRGIMQPYLVRMPIVSDMIVLFSIVWAFGLLLTPGNGSDRGAGMGPLLFIGVIAPGYYWFERWLQRWLPEPGVARGIFATSLFFATLHSGMWPIPIPIFVLSLFLGVLAYRSGSLLPSITLHALFNGVTMLFIAIVRFAK